MLATRNRGSRRKARGGSLIEILVTLIILLVGLLGLAGIMIQSQRAQVESYERVQALLILQDMVDRINANRESAGCYSTLSTPYVGTGVANITTACTVGTTSQRARALDDVNEWQDLLQGSSEVLGGQVGGMLDARGCVELVAGTTNVYQVSVVWQGRDITGAPPPAIACGTGLYGDERLRRAVSLTLQIATII